MYNKNRIAFAFWSTSTMCVQFNSPHIIRFFAVVEGSTDSLVYIHLLSWCACFCAKSINIHFYSNLVDESGRRAMRIWGTIQCVVHPINKQVQSHRANQMSSELILNVATEKKRN